MMEAGAVALYAWEASATEAFHLGPRIIISKCFQLGVIDRGSSPVVILGDLLKVMQLFGCRFGARARVL